MPLSVRMLCLTWPRTFCSCEKGANCWEERPLAFPGMALAGDQRDHRRLERDRNGRLQRSFFSPICVLTQLSLG